MTLRIVHWETGETRTVRLVSKDRYSVVVRLAHGVVARFCAETGHGIAEWNCWRLSVGGREAKGHPPLRATVRYEPESGVVHAAPRTKELPFAAPDDLDLVAGSDVGSWGRE